MEERISEQMTVLIYAVCILVAAVLQTLLRSLLAAGAVSVIPGTAVFCLAALWTARKWSSFHKEKKQSKEEQP